MYDLSAHAHSYTLTSFQAFYRLKQTEKSVTNKRNMKNHNWRESRPVRHLRTNNCEDLFYLHFAFTNKIKDLWYNLLMSLDCVASGTVLVPGVAMAIT